jgi:serine/threonine protein kinase
VLVADHLAVVKLTDFSISSRLSEENRMLVPPLAGAMKGTAAYISPEQVRTHRRPFLLSAPSTPPPVSPIAMPQVPASLGKSSHMSHFSSWRSYIIADLTFYRSCGRRNAPPTVTNGLPQETLKMSAKSQNGSNQPTTGPRKTNSGQVC